MTSQTRRQLLVDIAIAVALGSVAILITAHFIEGEVGEGRVDTFALTMIGLAFASLAIRRRWPIVTLGIATAVVSIYLLQSYPYGPILLAYFIAVYTVASRIPLRTAGIAVSLTMIVLLVHVWIHPSALSGARGLLLGSSWAVVPFAIGTTVQVVRESRAAARTDAVRQQLSDERIRLAQEVHDIVGHGLAAIQMQADVALHVNDKHPPETKRTLQSISRASAEAFEELRSTLDLMSAPRDTRRSPETPGLDDIGKLCERIRASGVHVELITEGDLTTVTPVVGLAAYRVVQESLTNVMRHGEMPSAIVQVKLKEDVIQLVVSNPGRVTAELTFGHGIDGMRHRVEAVGGTLDANPTEDGFRVEANLPLGDSE